MPLVPRSMTRLRPPVWRSRWKRSDRAWRWWNTLSAMLRMARCDDRREDGVAQLAEGLRQDAGHAIGQDQGHRHGDGLRRGLAQGIDGVLVEHRDVDVGDLGHDQQDQRHDHPAAQAGLALWPQIVADHAQNGPGAPQTELGNAMFGG